MKNKTNLNLLCSKLKTEGVDFYFISTSDEFLNEYVPNYNMRLKWVTNFSGSNGYALISPKKKIFFTDGRYLLQAKKEIHSSFEILDLKENSIVNFLTQKLKNKKILIDTKCFSKNFILDIINNLKSSKNTIIHDEKNLVDSIWFDRPKEKIKKFFTLKKEYSGRSFEDKLKEIRPSDERVLLITSPESICWLMNIRGYDLDHTPLVFCRLIVTKKSIEFFVNTEKLPSKFNITFKNLKVFDIKKFELRLKKFNKNKIQTDNYISYFFYKILTKNKFYFKTDPCKILKSKKNKKEIKYSRLAHLNDSVALIKFFRWLEEERINSNITEFEAAEKLEGFRKECNEYFSPSFPTISATGSNGSIIHYKPEKKSSILKDKQLYLCDSGGQYLGGTTDITRTIYLGKEKPNDQIKKIYTNVLIGHINISSLKFPLGTKGYQIDSLARFNLWNIGLDYNHGTGHGVGSFLGVHEGPQSISKNLNSVKLEPGMIISNEPGFYRNGKFGIRIENLVLVKESQLKNFLEFETLSLFPYEKRLIEFNLLNESQKKWIRRYHKEIFSKVSTYLDMRHKIWLKKKLKF